MFTELLPVLQYTMVTLTISGIDEQFLPNIIPKRKTDKESNVENVLCTLTVRATAAELDQDLAQQVVSFGHSYGRAAANIREIEEAHAAEEERKNDKATESAAPMAKTSSRSDNDSKSRTRWQTSIW